MIVLFILIFFFFTSFAPYLFKAIFAPLPPLSTSRFSLDSFPPALGPSQSFCCASTFSLRYTFPTRKHTWSRTSLSSAFWCPCTGVCIRLNTNIRYNGTVLSPTTSGRPTAARHFCTEVGESTILITNWRWLRYPVSFTPLGACASTVFETLCIIFLFLLLASSFCLLGLTL